MQLGGAESVTRRLALCAYGALLILILGWEAWAAPTTPVSRLFWLAIKLVPLLVPLPALWRGSARAHVLSALLVLLYFCEGTATAYGAWRSGSSAALGYATLEIVMSLAFIATASFYARFKWRRENARAPAGKES
jgi:uncharacterized membrane protein